VPKRRRTMPFRVVGSLVFASIFASAAFSASFGAGTARAEQVPCPGVDSGGPLPPGSQSISGLAMDGTNAVPDIQVHITSTAGGEGATLTTASGEYVFDSLGDGTYFISFFDSSGVYASGFYDAGSLTAAKDDATPVVLSGSGATGIDAVLQPETSSTISGFVTDVDGAGVAGAQVELRGTYFPLASCAVTEADGSYVLTGVRAGVYTGVASKSGFPAVAPTDPSIVVPPDDTTVDFQFPQVYALDGVVLDGDGVPVDSIGVSASRVGGGGSASAFSDGDGAFDLRGLVAGSYVIRYEDGSGRGRYRTGYYGGENTWVETVAEAVPVDVPGGPITLQVVPAPQVTGTITAPGVGAGLITISLCDETEENCSFASADGFGQYSVGALVPGTYRVRVSDNSDTYLSGYVGSGGTIVLDPNDALSIVVDATNVGPIDATLPEGGRISVHVSVAGVPFASAYVQVCQDEFACGDAFNTDGAGDGTSHALWPGTYYVSGTGNDLAYWFDTDGPESLDFASASPIVVSVGSSTSITLDLPGPGTPTDDGGPGVIAQVEVTPDDGSGNTPVSITFPDVTASGTTSLTTSEIGDPVPSGFQVGLPAFYFDITTTAQFTTPIVVCVTYVPTSYTDEANLRLFHFNGAWQDITVPPVDTVNNRICGATNALSPFVLAERTYRFGGFQGPKAPPKVNDAKAGDTIGLQFGLGGDFGLDVFVAGAPTTRQIDCTTGAAIGSEAAAGGSLKYNQKKDTYTFNWTTLKAWKNTCRSVTLTFRDGTHASLWYRLKP
jgi:hypothetical protein